MKKPHSDRIWFVSVDNNRTNEVVFKELDAIADEDVLVEDLCPEGQKFKNKLNLARLKSYDELKQLNERRKCFGLAFRVFVQDSPGGKIYRWPFDRGLRKLKKK